MMWRLITGRYMLIAMMVKQRMVKFWREWMRPLLVVVIVTSTFRSAVADWYDVPTGSMKPTILEGDRIFVNKIAYDLKIPFTAVGLARWKNPVRGDVVVFYSPFDGKRLVKRVVGAPGDLIEIRNSRVYVNGKPAAYEPVPEEMLRYIPSEELQFHAVSVEKIGTQEHPVMMMPDRASFRWMAPTRVPRAYYFVMGDNRDNSFDSRGFGFVSRDRIVGRAAAVVASLNPQRHYLPRWQRFFAPLL